MIRYHLIAFVFGFLLDLLLGDPYFIPHPVRGIGWLIVKLEKFLYREDHQIMRGFLLVFCVLLITFAWTGGALFIAYLLHPVCGVAVESIMTYQMLAIKCLKTESMKVYDQLQQGNMEEARKAVSMIVGRDTRCLDESGITKAAVETVAENTSDGVIAPMLYMAVGGPVLGFLYKAINTMDSMIGYKNDRYLYFGRIAARLDDAANYIPSRISAWIMILAAFIGGKEFAGKNAYRIYRRDKRKHASPNSAQTESVLAGALRVQLAGAASYFGKIVKKPYIGDDDRKIENEDIKRANKILYLTAGLCELFCIILLVLCCKLSGN